MLGRRIITVESDQPTITELCQYDQGLITALSERAMRGLDMITNPKMKDDDTSTALGFVALLRSKHPSTLLPPEENPQYQVLVSTSRAYAGYSSIDGPIQEQPDGIYTLIPA
jgi:hypothetical protein